jgi:hypothetical protein
MFDRCGEQYGRGAQDDLGMTMVSDEWHEGVNEGDGFVGGLEHLPVGGDEFFA